MYPVASKEINTPTSTGSNFLFREYFTHSNSPWVRLRAALVQLIFLPIDILNCFRMWDELEYAH